MKDQVKDTNKETYCSIEQGTVFKFTRDGSVCMKTGHLQHVILTGPNKGYVTNTGTDERVIQVLNPSITGELP